MDTAWSAVDRHRGEETAPHGGADLAHFDAVAHGYGLGVVLGLESINESGLGPHAEGVDNGVCGEVFGGAVFLLNSNAVLVDAEDLGAGHQTDAQLLHLGNDAITIDEHRILRHYVEHLNYGNVLAVVKRQLVSTVAAGFAAAADDDIVALDKAVVLMNLIHIVDIGSVEAGNGRANRLGAFADEYPVGRLKHGVVRLHFGVKVDFNAQLLHLYSVPVEESADVVLERGSGDHAGGTADVAVLFVQGNLVPLESGDPGGFQAGGAGADDDYVLRVVGLLNLERPLLADTGVDGAGDLRAAVPDAADAVLVAAQAGTDVLAMSGKQLVGNVGVCDKSTAHDGEVSLAGDYEVERGVGIVGAAVENGGLDVFARKVADIGHAGRALVGRREYVVEALVRTGVHVESVYAALLEPFNQFLGLFKGAAALPAVVESDTEEDGHVGAYNRADGLYDLAGETGTVLRGAAVLIGAVVEALGHELVNKITGVGMDLYGIKARVARNTGGVFEGFLKLFDLLNGHPAGENVRIEEGGLLTGGYEFVTELVGIAVAAGARSHLKAYFCSPAVDSLNEVRIRGNGDIALESAFVGALRYLLGEGRASSDYHANAAPGPFFKIVNFPVRLCAVWKRSVVAHRGEDDAVFDLHLANFKRGKKRTVIFLFHRQNFSLADFRIY